MTKRITKISIPDRLYKYRDWSNPNHRKIITEQEIYFSRPSEFNDPFDGNIPIRWDLMTYEDCFNKNLEIMNIVHHDKDQTALREYVQKITDEKKLWHPDILSKERDSQLKKWDTIMGLFSLTENRSNILMWSHYSNSHTGFVVGMDTNSLLTDYDFDFIEAINYQLEYPVISGLDDIDTQFYKKYFHKSDMWSYENEWRITKNHIENRVIQLKKHTICEIIIGCCMSDEATTDIIKSCRKYLKKDMPIYRTIKHPEEFGLTFERID